VADLKYFWNCHLFDSHKTTDPEGNLPEEEGFPEDFPEAEDFLEAEDSPEEADTQEEVEYHPEDHQEEVGDRHQPPYHKYNKENW